MNISLTENSLDLQSFAQQVNDLHFKVRDFVADPRDITTYTDQDGTLLKFRDKDEQFPINSWGHIQLASFCDIPQDYYKRMQATQHGLLDTSVRTWLDSVGGKGRMVRTIDGKVRAILSNRYRRIDNFDVANTVIPVLAEAGANFRRLHVTEEAMIIQAVFTEKKADVQVGDTIMLGVTIENNEVGKGSVAVLPMSLRLNCMNGATHNELGHKRQHVGTKIGGDGDPAEFFADDTLKASDEALMLQIRDVARKACSDTVLSTIQADFQRALAVPITALPIHAVTELSKRVGLNESEQAGVLQHLLTGGSMTQYSMVQAITRTAQDVNEGTRGHELEVIGGDVLAMAREQFGPIASAGAPPVRKRRA
jgi:hypothetical protein